MPPSRAKNKAAAAADVPISVRFPADLRTRTRRYADDHHVALATAIRMIVGDHLDELERDEGLSRSELWQRAQAWSALQTVADGAAQEASWEELRAVRAGASPKRGRAKRSAR